MRRINNLPVRNKFILLYLLGVLLPIIVLLIYVLTNIAAEIKTREDLNAEQSLNRIYSSLSSEFSSAVSLSNAIASDKTISALVQKDYETSTEYYQHYYSELRPFLKRYMLAYPRLVTNLSIFTSNDTIANGGHCLHITPQVESQEWYPMTLPADPQLSVYLGRQVGQTDILQLCITRSLSNTSPFTDILRIDLNMELINRLLLQEESFLSLYLVAPDGTTVSYPGSMQDNYMADRTVRPPANATLGIDFGEATAMAGWRLLAHANEEATRTNVMQSVLVGLLLGGVCSLFAGVMAWIFSNSIAIRTKGLLIHMDSMSAEHFSPINHDFSKDEIGELTAHFNAMGIRLKQVINDLYVLQLRQKSLELENIRAELKYLQAQIDPHFLFNTLNAILVLCVRNGHHEEADIIRALSKLLRRMVDTSHDTVALKEELDFVRMALKIEQFRFGDKLQYEFDITPEAEMRTVPVMSIQGLVENACKHGVQGNNERGYIRISARVNANDTLIVEVCDNGVGIPPARLKYLQEQVDSSQDMPDSIGLQNIYRRLSLQYGKSVKLILRNGDEGGTIAQIHIPSAQKGA